MTMTTEPKFSLSADKFVCHDVCDAAIPTLQAPMSPSTIMNRHFSHSWHFSQSLVTAYIEGGFIQSP